MENRMKLNLETTIKAIIESYKENKLLQADAIKAVLEPFKIPSYANKFSPEGLKQEIKEDMDKILSNWKKYDIALNQKVKEAIAGARSDLMKALNVENNKQPEDYAVRISNAREFIKMELDGKDMVTDSYKDMEDLDSVLFMILKDFVNDYGTMKLFSRMIQKKLMAHNMWKGVSNLPKTFGKMMKLDEIMSVLSQLDESAEMLFLYARIHSNEVIRINGNAYGVPIDGYGENVNEQNIVQCAAVLDGFADYIDSEGQY